MVKLHTLFFFIAVKAAYAEHNGYTHIPLLLDSVSFSCLCFVTDPLRSQPLGSQKPVEEGIFGRWLSPYLLIMGNKVSEQCALSDEELREFVSSTHFTREEVKALWFHFRSISGLEGMLTLF